MNDGPTFSSAAYRADNHATRNCWISSSAFAYYCVRAFRFRSSLLSSLFNLSSRLDVELGSCFIPSAACSRSRALLLKFGNYRDVYNLFQVRRRCTKKPRDFPQNASSYLLTSLYFFTGSRRAMLTEEVRNRHLYRRTVI